MRGQMQLPTPLAIPWDSNLRELQNAYLKSPTLLLKYVGFAVEVNQGCMKSRTGGWEAYWLLLQLLSYLKSRSSCITDVTWNPRLGSW